MIVITPLQCLDTYKPSFAHYQILVYAQVRSLDAFSLFDLSWFSNKGLWVSCLACMSHLFLHIGPPSTSSYNTRHEQAFTDSLAKCLCWLSLFVATVYSFGVNKLGFIEKAVTHLKLLQFKLHNWIYILYWWYKWKCVLLILELVDGLSLVIKTF